MFSLSSTCTITPFFCIYLDLDLFKKLFDPLVLAVFWKLVSGIYGLSRAARRSGGIAVSSTFSRTLSACNDSSLSFWRLQQTKSASERFFLKRNEWRESRIVVIVLSIDTVVKAIALTQLLSKIRAFRARDRRGKSVVYYARAAVYF
jgi:hypothetical protein